MNEHIIKRAVKYLRRGDVIIYPTETAYGFGADATNPAAVRAVFRLKGRAAGKALPLIVDSRRRAEIFFRFSPLAKKLAEQHWPGPLTLVLPVRRGAKIARGVISDGTAAVRVSAHPVARLLAGRLGRPIVSTSANRAGKPACYSVRALKEQFGALLGTVLIIDGGALPRRKPSTILRVTHDRVKLIRHGVIKP